MIAKTEASNTPPLRFTEFECSWKELLIEDIARVIRGASPRPKGDSRYYGGNVPRLMVQDVTRDGKWVTPKIDSLTEDGAKLSRSCSAGTMTIVCSGTVGVVSFLAIDACIHDGFLALTNIDLSKIHIDFLYHRLSTLREQFDKGATHGGVFTNLTTSGVKEFRFTLPLLPEQQKIADFLTAVDSRIGQLSQKKALLEDYKKGVMQQLFSQAIRFKDDDGGEYPDWEEKRLGIVCSTLKSGKGITSECISDDGEYPVFGGNGLRGYTNTFTHNSNLVLIGRQGALCGNINRSTGKAFISEHAVVVEANDQANTDWLGYRLDFMQLNRLSESSAQPGLAVNKLARIKLKIPSVQEQTKIANFLSAIGSKIENVSKQIEETRTFKQGLLQQMFV